MLDVLVAVAVDGVLDNGGLVEGAPGHDEAVAAAVAAGFPVVTVFDLFDIPEAAALLSVATLESLYEVGRMVLTPGFVGWSVAA